MQPGKGLRSSCWRVLVNLVSMVPLDDETEDEAAPLIPAVVVTMLNITSDDLPGLAAMASKDL